MNLLQILRSKIRKNKFLRKIIAYHLAPSGVFDNRILKLDIGDNFKKRIELVLSCPDNIFINRVPDAGKVKSGKQTMHNGLLINLGSYYGPEVAQQLFANKGVHEPQEEYVFQEVLRCIPPNATMIELGSFWSFYSMWFNSTIKGAKNYMIEPDEFNLGCGIRNFAINKLNGVFIHAFVGSENRIDEKGNKVIGIDDFCKDQNINFIDVLHSDIQGFEYQMLEGAIEMISNKRIGYLFISTHTNEIHYNCMKFILEQDYSIISSADLDQSYSEDGLIVAKSKIYKGVNSINISLR